MNVDRLDALSHPTIPEPELSRERPYVRLSAAISLDGKLHPEDEPASKIGSEADRHRLFSLRAMSRAIIVGARTLQVDYMPKTLPGVEDPAMNPLNVVLSTCLDLDLDLPFFRSSSIRRVIVTTAKASPEQMTRVARVATVFVVPPVHGQVSVVHTLVELAGFGIDACLLEGGGKLNHSFLRENLIDELHLTLCPRALGGQGNAALFDGPGFKEANRRLFTLGECRQVGEELFLVYRSRVTLAESGSPARETETPERLLPAVDRSKIDKIAR
jgi:riboflavin-specific deaminase-like protein